MEKKVWVKTFKIRINTSIATIDVACFDSERFVCLFNKEKHKNFIEGFKALGFKVSITSLGDKTINYFPIKLSSSSTLTEEVMKNIWDKINKKIEKDD